MHTGIRLAHSTASGAREAAQEFHALVQQPDMSLVVFFCSSEYGLSELASEMHRLFGEVPVVGCTTAGEIGPGGYRDHSLAGASFSADGFAVVSGHLDDLRQFELSEGQTFGRSLLRQLESQAPSANLQNTFAFMLIDGLSVREEPVARAFQSALGKIPLVGGSAGDGLRFGKTEVYAGGSFLSNRAALTLVSTPLPFTIFKTQHFVPSDQRLVITGADCAQRVVREINGLPAAEEYARLLGVEVNELNPRRFAASPVVVLIDGNNYVRSVQKVNPDGSLTFYCAIEEGVVLRIARGVDLVENLEHAFADIGNAVGAPEIVLSFDCILRRLEIAQNQTEESISEIFRRNRALGFNTYGEQFRGIHVNQTLSGVAIGGGRRHHA